MDQIKSNKAVKCAITVNHNGKERKLLLTEYFSVCVCLCVGDTINTESNDSNIDELSLKALARTGYQYITSVRSATSQYDINENVQVLRVRLKEDEITIVPGEWP